VLWLVSNVPTVPEKVSIQAPEQLGFVPDQHSVADVMKVDAEALAQMNPVTLKLIGPV
jgi:hypothetical protein